ncbi:hypothetical protein F3Y22_tig00110332pilonHSYRG00620 [Hibiscus syriacus]|uniref:Uncharacterized protein n=1 Tax=Hibiscus syriacus TaxID=106335 RepID=A0A6A3B0S5_HIBSY|nr:hypothetical protein F3Y22_tig00110332pilonHSYRG00620 [Hibiscus syriacus]
MLGSVKLQGADLQYGKLVISVQVTTPVAPTLMMSNELQLVFLLKLSAST